MYSPKVTEEKYIAALAALRESKRIRNEQNIDNYKGFDISRENMERWWPMMKLDDNLYRLIETRTLYDVIEGLKNYK